MSQVVTLLSFFTFAEEDGGEGFYTPWVNFPADHQCAEYWIDCKTYHSGSADITLQSSIDGDAIQTVSGPTTISTAGLARAEITESLAPQVRLFIKESGGVGGSILTLSIWLVPKIGGG